MARRTQRAVIAGAGLGGLALALRLAARGWQVTVCEQADAPGGKMNRWVSHGFSFDTGPSLLTLPWVFEELFDAAGEKLHEHLQLVRMPTLGRYVYDDGAAFTYTANLPEWLDTLRAIGPRDADGFFRFMRLGARLYELSCETFLRRPVSAPPDMRVLRALRHLPFRHAWGNYHRSVAAHFHSPYLRQLYDRYPTFVGSSPYACPATLLVIPYIEYALGGWYVLGGLHRLVEALIALLEARKADIRTATPITAICHASGRVTGVVTGAGERIPADVVAFNGDAAQAPRLLGRDASPLSRESSRSLSGLVFVVARGRNLPELHHHNVYFSADYPREFDDLFMRRMHPADPTVYVSIPSRTDRSLVPGAGETLFIMSNAPATDATAWTDATVAQARRQVFARLKKSGFPDIDRDIVAETSCTPRTLAERYDMPGGAIYGSHSHGWRGAFYRPPNADGRIAGLYYVGGSVHPGGGTPTVLQSAAIVDELIKRHERP